MTTTAFADNDFSITDLIGKVRDIALEHPTTVYEKEESLDPGETTWCSYSKGHSSGVGPGCLYGQILPAALVALDPQADIYEVLVDHIELDYDEIHTGDLDYDGVSISTQEMNWIAAVQSNQDLGWTWARAVEQADINYPLD